MNLPALFLGLALLTSRAADAFVSQRFNTKASFIKLDSPSSFVTKPAIRNSKQVSKTSLQMALLNVPDNFFAISFGVTGFMLSVMRNVHRSRMEELAWEQRLTESRERKLAADPSLVELDLLKQEAENEWSAYGPQAMEERRQRAKVAVGEQIDEDDDDNDGYARRAPTEFKMSDEEIAQFEREYGVDYDPYYDDPYTEEELPTDLKFRTDKKYGDRIYENGEIFYMDKESGMYYRQGSKPRIKGFW